MFDAPLPEPQAVLEGVLQSTGMELLLATDTGRVLAGSDGLAGMLGLRPAQLAPGAALPDVESLAAGRAEVRIMQVPGRRVAYLFHRPTAAAAEALHRENAALRETLDAVDGTVVVYDADLRYVFANRAYHEYFPHLPDDAELAGRPYRDILAMSLKAGRGIAPVPEDQREAYIARRVAAMQQRPVEPREQYDRRIGRWYLVRVRWTPAGRRVALRVEIDEQKRLQKELLWAREAAVAAAQDNRTSMANAAEAMRGPLEALAELVSAKTTDTTAARRAVLDLMALADRLDQRATEKP